MFLMGFGAVSASSQGGGKGWSKVRRALSDIVELTKVLY